MAAGLRPEPIAAVVSRSGAVPTDIPLFAEPESRVVVFTARELDTSACAAEVEVVRLDPEQVTMTTALRHLRAEHGVRLLLCEGGPTVFGALTARGPRRRAVLDDLAEAVRRRHGADDHQRPELPELLDLDLRWAVEHEGSLFLRYATR